MERVMALALAAMAITGVLLVAKAAVIAFNLSIATARPTFFHRVETAYRSHPWRAAAIGTANTMVALFFIAVLLNTQPLALIGLAMTAGLCAVHILGRTAYYQRIAERLLGSPGAGRTPAELARAAAVAELSFLVPVLGQGLFLAVTMRCAGAFIMALLSRSVPEIQNGSDPAGGEIQR